MAQATRPVEQEAEHGRAISQAFASQADIVSAGVLSHGAPSAVNAEEQRERMTPDALAEALLLHAQDPVSSTSEALANRFGLSREDVTLLQSTLEHCVPFRVHVAADGKPMGVPLTEDTRDWRDRAHDI